MEFITELIACAAEYAFKRYPCPFKGNHRSHYYVNGICPGISESDIVVQ